MKSEVRISFGWDRNYQGCQVHHIITDKSFILQSENSHAPARHVRVSHIRDSLYNESNLNYLIPKHTFYKSPKGKA